jgi:hypothetical protein
VPLTVAEQMRERVPAIRAAEETAQARPLTPEEQMAYYVNVALARKTMRPGRQRFDEWNRPL